MLQKNTHIYNISNDFQAVYGAALLHSKCNEPRLKPSGLCSQVVLAGGLGEVGVCLLTPLIMRTQAPFKGILPTGQQLIIVVICTSLNFSHVHTKANKTFPQRNMKGLISTHKTSRKWRSLAKLHAKRITDDLGGYSVDRPGFASHGSNKKR